jgi:hypothetical protein
MSVPNFTYISMKLKAKEKFRMIAMLLFDIKKNIYHLYKSNIPFYNPFHGP